MNVQRNLLLLLILAAVAEPRLGPAGCARIRKGKERFGRRRVDPGFLRHLAYTGHFPWLVAPASGSRHR